MKKLAVDPLTQFMKDAESKIKAFREEQRNYNKTLKPPGTMYERYGMHEIDVWQDKFIKIGGVEVF